MRQWSGYGRFGLSNKRTLLGIIVFLIFFGGVSSFIYIDSYQATLEEQRKMTYGSWHAAVYDTEEKTEKNLNSHATVHKCGTMKVLGKVVDISGSISGNIGIVDEQFISIGNIELLSGRMPSKKNEIAIESLYLTQMGYSYELGQEIEIRIQYYNSNEDIIEEYATFKLTGVIRNYSAHWKSNGQLVSFFVGEDFTESRKMPGIINHHVFVELKEEFFENVDSLSILCSEGSFVKNDYVYEDYIEKYDANASQLILHIILLSTGCISIFILIHNELEKHRTSLLTLRMLGAEKIQIIGIFLYKKISTIIGSSILGILCGVLGSYVVFWGLRQSEIYQIVYDVRWQHIWQLNIVYGVGIILSLGLGLLSIFKIPLRGKVQQQSAMKLTFKRRKNMNEKNVAHVMVALNYRRAILSICLMFTASALLFISVYQTWEDYKAFEFYCEHYPEDYSFGYLNSYYTSKDTMEEETVKQIESTYGVGTVQTIAISEYCKLDFSGENNKKYTSLVNEKVMGIQSNEEGNIESYGAFIGLSDNLFSIYASEIDSTSLFDETLKNGQIMLYLPDFYLDEKNELHQIDLEGDLFKTGKILSEDTIQVGDSVSINVNEKKLNLEIIGVIKKFDKSISLNPTKPYSLICNKETYRYIWGCYKPAYVTIYGNNTDIPYQTDIELSKIKTELYFNNNRIEREEQKNNLVMKLILSLVMAFSILIFMILIRIGIHISTEKQEVKRYQILYQLGMEREKIMGAFIKNALFESICGTSLGLCILFLVRFFAEKKIILSLSDSIWTNSLQSYLKVFKRILFYTDFKMIILLFSIIVVINFAIPILFDYKYIYNETMF